MAKMSRRANNTIEDFKDIASRATSPSAIDAFLSMAPKPPTHAFIRQSIVFHQGNLLDAIGGKLHDGSLRGKVLNLSPGAIQLSYKRPGNARQIHRGVITIIPGSEPGLHRLITVSYSAFWYEAVRKFIRGLYPQAMPVFFKQSEIREALKKFEHSLRLGHTIRIAEVTMKRSRVKERGRVEPRFETDRLWTRLSITEAFDQALERNQWFTSVSFRVQYQAKEYDPPRPVANGRIYKRGEIYYDFLHQELSNYLIPVLEANAAERLKFFQGRGIRERNYKPGLPIEISYQSNVFDDVMEIRRLGQVVAKYPNATKAVYHSNPYYRASIADFFDGSSFEIWVLSPRRILLVPQAKSSEQALERLISYIFLEFKEGVINEYKE